MIKFFFLLIVLQVNVHVCFAQPSVQVLLCENLTDPIGVDVAKPRLTWQLISNKRNVMQSAYEIKVYSSYNGTDIVWATGKVNSDQSVHISYGGTPLLSGKRYFWKVRVWDNEGKASEWSADAYWQMGLLNTADWKAKWIQLGYQEDSTMRASPLFRKEFTVAKKILSATAYITAHGLYEAQINGQRVGDAFLTPGWTSYNKRLQYQVYDVRELLKSGPNAIAVTLGNGWYRGYIGYSGDKNFYGKSVALLLQLDITYIDGTTTTIVTNDSWKSATGSIKSSEIYDGEYIDARDDKIGWTLPGYNDAGWNGIIYGDFSENNLVATYNEPVRKHETFKPLRIITTPKDEKVIDFGQNLVGWVIVKAKGKPGDRITISHAEVLDKAGNFYTENLRSAKAQDTYILNGNGEEVFEPHFTFHGFQFIKVEGYPGELKPDDFTAVALYSDMKKTGSFTSSNALINQLQHNIEWGQRGNFLDVPTDCPQRDERLGWTGDAQVFSRTAAYNMGTNNFFAKWLKDIAADQEDNGSVPFVVPNVLGPHDGGATGWADVCTIIPWNMYLVYGDRRILEQQYSSMKAWVDYMKAKSKNDLWNSGFHFGDWLFYSPEDDVDGRAAVTDKYLIAQCFYAHSTQLLINTAAVLGKTEDSSNYSALLERIKNAFAKEYLTPNGRLVSGTQTAYAVSLNFDMLPESFRTQAAERLAQNVNDYDNHLTTGFLGTPYLSHVLSRYGYTDIAYKLLLQDTYPSWLYPVKMGATTIWERWDGIKPDSTFQVPSMNSYNHYSYGAIGDWMYRVMAGLDTYGDGVGYKHIKVMPHLGGGFTSVKADLKTYYGDVASHWKVENEMLLLDIEIPVNTKADIFIPATSVKSVLENGNSLYASKNLLIVGVEDEYVHLKAGSGEYHFAVTKE